MKDINTLSSTMRADWDRRIEQDYRFWMSDGHADDQAMWSSGKRDLAIITEGLEKTNNLSVLEIGCGVGRLLYSALGSFKKVIGFDVSAVAIRKAKELLPEAQNLELYIGDGISLKPMTDGSVDFVYSFAALTSMPVDVIASYLIEASRVLKDEGILRLQVYLGKEQPTKQEDTLHPRCFAKTNLEAALSAAGFKIEWQRELKLPFKVSFKEIGIEAVVLSAKKVKNATQTVPELAKLLAPNGELPGRSLDLEYWMELNHAKELAAAGEVSRAREILAAVKDCTSTTIDLSNLINQVVRTIEEKSTTDRTVVDNNAIFERNLEVIKSRFPEAYLRLMAPNKEDVNVSVANTEQGPVINLNNQCLDHPSKPSTAAESWVKKCLAEGRYSKAKAIIVFGFGTGYHVDELIEEAEARIGVVEPCIAAFKLALSVRDLEFSLSRLAWLYLGDDPNITNFDEESELLVRPQAQLFAVNLVNKIKGKFYGVKGFTDLRPSIAVVGPFQGGTLPITAYTTNALMGLKQRVRQIDTSPFVHGFHHLENLNKDRYRLAHIQGVYTEMVAQTVLASIDEKPVDIVIVMAQAPLTGRVLTELRKRGIITVLWFVEDYLRFTYWREIAQFYDFVFTIQTGECLDLIKAAGAGEVHYLPSACDPAIHRTVELSEEERARWGSPISFVGAGYHNRQQTFAAFAELPFKIWGTEWPGCRPFDKLVQENGRRLSPDEYIKIFNGTDININLHSSSERDGVDPFGDFLNPRTFELAACGAFQLVDERALLAENFKPGEEIVTFRDTRDLMQKISYYSTRPEERKQIAARAKERALREHTYAQRLQKMLEIIFSSRFEHLKHRREESPWRRMIESAKFDAELMKRCEAAFERGEEPILDGLISDIMHGHGKLSETEQKLLFLFHVRKQIIHMRKEETGENR